MSAPVLRSQSFIWSDQGVVPSGFNALAGSWAVGWLQDSTSADAALLSLPAWPSVLQPEAPLPLSNPYRIAEELFGDLAGETGFSVGNINVVATAIAVEPGTDEPLVALQLSDASDPDFEKHDPDGVLLPLINLEQLTAPVDSLAPLPASAFAAWTSLLPDELITQLLHLPALLLPELRLLMHALLTAQLP